MKQPTLLVLLFVEALSLLLSQTKVSLLHSYVSFQRETTAALASVRGSREQQNTRIKKRPQSLADQQSAIESLQFWMDGDWVAVDPKHDWNLTLDEAGYTIEDPGVLDPLYFKPTHLEFIDPLTLEQALEQRLAYDPAANFTLDLKSKPDTIPVDDTIRFHRFQPDEAQQCLQNKRVLMLGDSHMRNLWRALNDVISGLGNNHYLRFDGHKAQSADQTLPAYLSPNYRAASFPMPLEYVGIPGACKVKPEKQRKYDHGGYGGYIGCNGDVQRRPFDLRTLGNDQAEASNITIDFSICATSAKNILAKDPEGKTDGPKCKSGVNTRVFAAPDTISQWEGIIEEQRNGKTSYDYLIMGYHIHDIKKEICPDIKAGDREEIAACRKQEGIHLLQNIDKLASDAKEVGIKLIWTTHTSENLLRIPEEYRAFQNVDEVAVERRAMAGIMRNYGHVVLDTYHMSYSADEKYEAVTKANGTWPFAHEKGNHDARYLARTRIHVILNHLCSSMLRDQS